MITWVIEQYETVDSTMNIIHDRARGGDAEGLVITATQQSTGRGRGGNVWIAPMGNLYCSILLRPHIHAREAGQYSFITAVALGRAFADIISPPHHFHHKWPNDVLINGKKGAGILLESDITPDGMVSYLNIGVGVNILNAPNDRICVADVAFNPVTVTDFLNHFLSHLNNVMKDHARYGFNHIRDEWMTHAQGIGESMSVRLPNKTIHGVFLGVRDDGALHIQTDDKTSTFISSGEVYFG